MADKKKMSVAEILAAARKADSQGGAAQATDSPADSPPADGAAAPAAESAPVASESKPKPVKSASGGRLSVAEMMAAARAEKAPGAKPTAKPAAAKAAAPKPAPAAKPAAKADSPAKPAERNTDSILAAARKAAKPGPMTKAEAAAKAKADPTAAPAKPKVVVPPMPEKPAYAKPGAIAAKAEEPVEQSRRNFMSIGFWMLGLVSALWTLATVKFMFPNVRREPPSKFKVGFPDAYPPGQVSEKYKAQFGVWVVNTEYNGQPEIFALKTVCTHLGCTPNWLEAEQKFKCPCHGSGFYKDGINFEGPAPRPLERYAIRIAEDGQIEIDKSKTFQEEMGAWTDPSSYIPV